MSTTVSPAVDWTVLDNPAVLRNCSLVARNVAREFNGVMEYDDVLQEAYILCATNAEKVRAYVESEDIGYLNRWLYLKIGTVVRREFSSFHKHVEVLDER